MSAARKDIPFIPGDEWEVIQLPVDENELQEFIEGGYGGLVGNITGSYKVTGHEFKTISPDILNAATAKLISVTGSLWLTRVCDTLGMFESLTDVSEHLRVGGGDRTNKDEMATTDYALKVLRGFDALTAVGVLMVCNVEPTEFEAFANVVSARHVIIEGLRQGAEVTALNKLNRVESAFVLHCSSVVALNAFASLESAAIVSFSSNYDLETVELNALTSCDRLDVDANLALKEVHLDNLVRCAELRINHSKNVTVLQLPCLQECRKLGLGLLEGLEVLQIPVLAECGDINISNCDNVKDLNGFLALRKVESLQLSITSGFDRICFPNLTHVADVLAIVGVNGLEATDESTFPELQSVGELRFISNGRLSQIGGFQSLTQLGRLEIENNGRMREVTAFASLDNVDVFFGETPKYTIPESLRLNAFLPEYEPGCACGTVPYWVVGAEETIFEYGPSFDFEFESPAAWHSCAWYWLYVIVTPIVAARTVYGGPVLAGMFTVHLVAETLLAGLFYAEVTRPKSKGDQMEWTGKNACCTFFGDEKAFGVVSKPHTNVIAVASVALQAMQLASFAFNPTFPWPLPVSSTGQAVGGALPLRDSALTFQITFWIAFALVVLINVAMFAGTASRGAVNFLSTFAPLLFIPVSRGVYSALVCTYDASTGVSWLDATIDADNPSPADQMECWRGLHLMYVCFGMVGLALSHATMAFLIVKLQGMSKDVQLTLLPKTLLIETELKFGLVVLTAWFSGEGREWLHIAFNIIILFVLFVVTVATRPGPPNRPWFDVYRGALFLMALEAAVASAVVVSTGSEGSWAVFGAVAGSWVLTAIGAIVVGKFFVTEREDTEHAPREVEPSPIDDLMAKLEAEEKAGKEHKGEESGGSGGDVESGLSGGAPGGGSSSSSSE